MTQKIITNHITSTSTLDIINKHSKNVKHIVVAVAFFSDESLINEWLSAGKKVTLIVSLRPPTNYYSLKNILYKENLEVYFFGDEFHSKIFSFYDERNHMISTIVGSSNFTNGGLTKNIETNVVITEDETLIQVHDLQVELK